jgi:hypothetical protein
MAEETLEPKKAAPQKKAASRRRIQAKNTPAGHQAATARTAPPKKAASPQQGRAQNSAAGSKASSAGAAEQAARDTLAGIAGTTSRVVNKAVSILEEELAIGIGATQDIEQKFVDVNKVRSADPEEVMQRFRKDSHDVVDIMLDLINVATNGLGNLSDRALKIGITQPKKSGEKSSAGVIPSLAVPTVVKPGEAVEIPMTLENESDKATESFVFHCSDLMNTAGESISARQVTFSPERLIIEPQKATILTVIVNVPDNASPGVYSGLLQATRMDQLRAVLTIQIG